MTDTCDRLKDCRIFRTTTTRHFIALLQAGKIGPVDLDRMREPFMEIRQQDKTEME
jgi:hypothetical protein